MPFEGEFCLFCLIIFLQMLLKGKELSAFVLSKGPLCCLNKNVLRRQEMIVKGKGLHLNSRNCV